MSIQSAVKAFVTKTAPSFAGTSYSPVSKTFKQIKLEDYSNKYVLLFFYPLDFTFVCPTEIIQFSSLAAKFREHNCEVIGCSVDSHFSHMEYVNKPRNQGGLGKELQIDLLSDLSKSISRDYGVLLDSGIALRGTFIIDGKKVLRHSSINDLPVGRNVEEYLRLVQAFQYADQHGEVCPASWTPGSDTMKPNWESEKTSNYWKNVHANKK
ncbi:peroxiredoxin 2, putative [Ichthyophthirius multifiliis]|uniref:thioredoxin-dependent peroxiredoxin n=1 Tax=Ichthyophthirius multifiliis TaxID=5932 RepID=G0QYW9_ICHMU|nr:peroxiredoxin 2, putative [Ichthyophthirius multifiliis]EGR29584.1 peroxiredoxin 2, putative [Ichthyophthirius multifiliis]|eukprot:XP_004030820.1 peroxiredoxin 2, putative [Ichthyophthirius multifiliis]